jgi:cyclophilin family peptidyl-prolyl cis-trans isomerase
MRLFAVLAAMAGLMFAVPAAAQGRAPKAPAQPLSGVGADATVLDKLPAVLPPEPENTWVLDLSTGGRVLIRLRPDAAPQMVERIKTLTRRHFYDGLVFHRVIEDPYWIAQGGDPKGDGTGDSDLPNVPAEFNLLPHVRGTVSAARRGAPDNATPDQTKEAENSANSQFFIMIRPKMTFDQNYTVFGRVYAGMQWVDALERGEPPTNPSRIVHAYILSDNPPAYANAPKPAPAAVPLLVEGPPAPPVAKPATPKAKPKPRK